MLAVYLPYVCTKCAIRQFDNQAAELWPPFPIRTREPSLIAKPSNLFRFLRIRFANRRIGILHGGRRFFDRRRHRFRGRVEIERERRGSRNLDVEIHAFQMR